MVGGPETQTKGPQLEKAKSWGALSLSPSLYSTSFVFWPVHWTKCNRLKIIKLIFMNSAFSGHVPSTGNSYNLDPGPPRKAKENVACPDTTSWFHRAQVQRGAALSAHSLGTFFTGHCGPWDKEGRAGVGWALNSSSPGSPGTPKFFYISKPLFFQLALNSPTYMVVVPSTS